MQHGRTGHDPEGGRRAGLKPPLQPHSRVFGVLEGELLLRLLAEGAGRRDFRLFIHLLDEFPDSPPHRWYQRGDIMGPGGRGGNSPLPSGQVLGKVAKVP